MIALNLHCHRIGYGDALEGGQDHLALVARTSLSDSRGIAQGR
jgi:hypothetical protein